MCVGTKRTCEKLLKYLKSSRAHALNSDGVSFSSWMNLLESSPVSFELKWQTQLQLN